MKSLILITAFLSLALSAQASQTSGTFQETVTPARACAEHAALIVEAQATIDFPGRKLTAIPPDLGNWDGGYVTDADIRVVETGNPSQVAAVYSVMIDETCSVEIQH